MTLMEAFRTSVMYHACHQTVTSLQISFGIVQFGMFLVGFQNGTRSKGIKEPRFRTLRGGCSEKYKIQIRTLCKGIQNPKYKNCIDEKIVSGNHVSQNRVPNTKFLIRFCLCISNTEPLEPNQEPEVLQKAEKVKMKTIVYRRHTKIMPIEMATFFGLATILIKCSQKLKDPKSSKRRMTD